MKRTDLCKCSNAELREIGGMADGEWRAEPNSLMAESRRQPGDALVEPRQSDIAMIRLVCRNVLKYRNLRDENSEANALTQILGSRHRWGSRGQNCDAPSYITRNVCPHVEWVRRSISKKHRRRLERLALKAREEQPIANGL